jgi:hypothetical protein
MATAQKLALLQKIKQDKGVLYRSFLNDLTKHKKCEKWKEVTQLVESLGLAVAVLLQHTVVELAKEDIGKNCNTCRFEPCNIY